jgi:hypothetical protein
MVLLAHGHSNSECCGNDLVCNLGMADKQRPNGTRRVMGGHLRFPVRLAIYMTPSELLVIVGALLLLCIIPTWCFWHIMKKAGYNRWWGIAALIPGGAAVLTFCLAFGKWPASTRKQ